MPTLIVDLHCMCLFVPDKDMKSVHVLMPAMHGPGHAHHGHAGSTGKTDRDSSGRASAGKATAHVPEKHVVRMLHRSFTKQPQGRPMEGWSLVLRGGAPANLDLNAPLHAEAVLPDLTPIARRRVPGSLVYSSAPKGVISRVTFEGGAVIARHPDPLQWDLGGLTNRVLANQVSWVIPNVPEKLEWDRLGAIGDPPIESLRQIDAEAHDLYRIGIHHETEKTLPGGGGGPLSIKEMREHFAAYYGLLGVNPLPAETDPKKKKWFPEDQSGGGGGGVKCISAMAQLSAT